MAYYGDQYRIFQVDMQSRSVAFLIGCFGIQTLTNDVIVEDIRYRK